MLGTAVVDVLRLNTMFTAQSETKGPTFLSIVFLFLGEFRSVSGNHLNVISLFFLLFIQF